MNILKILLVGSVLLASLFAGAVPAVAYMGYYGYSGYSGYGYSPYSYSGYGYGYSPYSYWYTGPYYAPHQFWGHTYYPGYYYGALFYSQQNNLVQLNQKNLQMTYDFISQNSLS